MDEKSFEPFNRLMQRINLQTIDSLPDTVPPELGTGKCHCPVKFVGCDGYGHVEKNGQAYACPNMLRLQAEESLDFQQILLRKNSPIHRDNQVDIPGTSTGTKAQKEGTSTGMPLGTGEGRP